MDNHTHSITRSISKPGKNIRGITPTIEAILLIVITITITIIAVYYVTTRLGTTAVTISVTCRANIMMITESNATILSICNIGQRNITRIVVYGKDIVYTYSLELGRGKCISLRLNFTGVRLVEYCCDNTCRVS